MKWRCDITVTSPCHQGGWGQRAEHEPADTAAPGDAAVPAGAAAGEYRNTFNDVTVLNNSSRACQMCYPIKENVKPGNCRNKDATPPASLSKLSLALLSSNQSQLLESALRIASGHASDPPTHLQVTHLDAAGKHTAVCVGQHEVRPVSPDISSVGQPGAYTYRYRGGHRKVEFAVCYYSETWTGVPTAEQFACLCCVLFRPTHDILNYLANNRL